MRYLTTDDRDERLLLLAVGQEAVRTLDLLHKNLAAHIIHTYAKARR